jgi:hypothetical protein
MTANRHRYGRGGRVFFSKYPQAGKQEMIFFNVLRSEQSFLCPEVAIGRMFVAFDEEESGRKNTSSLDVFSCCCDWLIFTTFDTILRHVFENSASFLTAATLAFASPGQCYIPPFFANGCSYSYKITSQIYQIESKISTSFCRDSSECVRKASQPAPTLGRLRCQNSRARILTKV